MSRQVRAGILWPLLPYLLLIFLRRLVDDAADGIRSPLFHPLADVGIGAQGDGIKPQKTLQLFR